MERNKIQVKGEYRMNYSELSLEELRPNPYQPRKIFNDDALTDLANSIKEHGVLPIHRLSFLKSFFEGE